jgi:hypothetical protein
VIDLEDGHSALKLTTASYRRPNGKNIHRFPDAKETDQWGVTPDAGYEIKLANNEMETLIHDRRARDVLLLPPSADKVVAATSHPPSTESKPAAADRQLQAAIKYLTVELAKAR